MPYASGIVEYRLDSLGRETVPTALGARDAEKYELSRPDGGSGRVRITLWLSPADDWLPVLAVRSRKHKERARAEIESPRWVPILMTVLLALGLITIMLRYIVWQDTNIPVLVGLVFLLGGLYTATRWH